MQREERRSSERGLLTLLLRGAHRVEHAPLRPDPHRSDRGFDSFLWWFAVGLPLSLPYLPVWLYNKKDKTFQNLILKIYVYIAPPTRYPTVQLLPRALWTCSRWTAQLSCQPLNVISCFYGDRDNGSAARGSPPLLSHRAAGDSWDAERSRVSSFCRTHHQINRPPPPPTPLFINLVCTHI